jgi:hypothetical protein
MVLPDKPGANSLKADSSPKAAAKTGDMLPLPPIRYLDSMPWMNWNTSALDRGKDTGKRLVRSRK